MTSLKSLTTSTSVRGGRWPVLVATLAILATFAFGSVAIADDREDGAVRVMTRNLYQGFDPSGILAATDPGSLLAAAAAAYNMVMASKPAERAAAVAREIVANWVDLV